MLAAASGLRKVPWLEGCPSWLEAWPDDASGWLAARHVGQTGAGGSAEEAGGDAGAGGTSSGMLGCCRGWMGAAMGSGGRSMLCTARLAQQLTATVLCCLGC